MEEKIQELADSIYIRKVRRARALTVGERIDTGIELFEGSLEMMRAGIRHQFPEKDETEVDATLRERLARLKQVHEHGLYSKTPI